MAHVELRLLAAPALDGFPFADISHGARLAVGYGSARSAPVFEGEVTAVEFRMGDGPPELVILAEDALHRLARQMLPRSLIEMRADDVVNLLAQSAGLQADATLGGPVQTFVKGAESDLAFLLRMVAARGAALRLEGDRVRAGPETTDPAPLPIDAGSLSELRIIADLNWLPGAVTVRGWNLAEAVPVETSTVPAPAPQPELQSGAALADQLGWGADYFVPRDFVGAAEADAIATAEASRAAERFLHGEIVATERRLVPGAEIEVTGADPRFEGLYRVGDCRHRFSVTGGFTVRAQIARPTWRASPRRQPR